MSSNLLKGGMLNTGSGERRIIDTNTLVAERIGALMQELQELPNDGFTQGLQVEEIDVSSLLSDQDEDGSGEERERAQITPEEAREQAEVILQDARNAAAQILQDALRDGEAEVEALRRKAQEEGYQEGRHKAEQELRKRERELENRRDELEEQYNALVAELEPKFVDTLSGIYEHLFHVELGGYRDILIQLISDCMRGTDGSKSFQIRVSREDYNYVSTKKARLMEAAGAGEVSLEIVEDANLGKNACTIRTDNGILDCGLGTQLDELTRRLKLLAYEKK